MATKKTAPQVTIETLNEQKKAQADLSHFTVTDETGRVLEVRQLDVVEELDVLGLIGKQSENLEVLGRYSIAAAVRKINGEPRPFPQTIKQLRDCLRTLGHEGLNAILTRMIELNPNLTKSGDEAEAVEDFRDDVGNE